MKIFITVGTQKFPMDRLLKAADDYSKTHDAEIFAQTGASDYVPSYAYSKYIDKDEFDRRMSEADIVITHGGTGAIIGALKKGRKVIAVPRLSKYGEHVDNHQEQITGVFSEKGYAVECKDMDIESAIEEAMSREFKKFTSNTDVFLKDIRKCINERQEE